MRRHQALRPVHIVLSALLPAALWVSLAFAAGAAKPPPLPPPPPSDSLAYIRQITFGTPPCEGCAPRVCPGEPVVVTVSGLMPARCVAFRGLHEEPAGGSHVLAADFVIDTCGPACPTLIVPFSARIDLPAQAAGRYTELFVERVRVCPDTTAVGSIRTAGLAYEVVASCPVEPPPLDSLVRTFASLRVRPEHPCPGDSLRLEFDENGCPPCVHLVSLGRDPDNHLRAVLEWRPHCVEFACISDTLSYALGRFAAGSYVVTTPVDVHVLDAGTPDSTISFEKRVAFDVQRVCGVPEAGCLHSPLPPRGSLVPECSLRVPPGGHGDVLVPVRNDLTATGVAGVEGFMATFQPFHIVDIRYAGAATGVHVS